MVKVGFLGPRGTFSQEAVEFYIKGKEYSCVDYNTIPELIMAVREGDIDEAVTPIENSLEGAVNTTLDMLAFDVELKIKAEIVIEIRQNLLAKSGTALKDIKRVISHPQAVGQCRKFLHTNLPAAEIGLVYSTAGAADEVVRGESSLAAIGSAAAAQVYGLEILASDIQDSSKNFTRFVAISKDDSTKTGSDKTSIVFSTEDKPGSLYKILDIFNLWDINMARIESRPAKNQLGKYIFFVDVEGHKDDFDVRDALTMIKRKSSFYKFLGSYPRYT